MELDCEICREALSARLDGEAEPIPTARTDAHLEQCRSCTQWCRDAENLTRTLRVRVAPVTPDLAEAVLAAAPPQWNALRWRVALGVIGVGQLGLAMSQLLTGGTAGHAGHTGQALASHLFDEGAAWNLALAVGLILAALQTERATGLLPALGGFLLVLAPLSVRDLLNGDATVGRVGTHLLLLPGLVLLYLVARAHRAMSPDGPEIAGTGDLGQQTGQQPPDPMGSTHRGRRIGRHLRPSARRRAA